MPPGSATPAAVLFDMDGTLFDSERLWDVALDELAVRLGGTLSRSARLAMVGQTTLSSMRLLHADVGLSGDGIEVSGAWLEDRVRELFAVGVAWRPGAADLVASVRAAGVPTALVTSTRRALVDVALRSSGASFDAVVCGDEVARPKPDPEPYRLAAGLLGVDPARCVAVEDSVAGATSAEAAGCAVLVVPSEAPVPGAPRRVLRDSLVGLDLDGLAAVAAAVAPTPAGA